MGRLRTLVEHGYYGYVGRAFGAGGLAARVGHHWHIDYLRAVCELVEVWFATDTIRREHSWAKALTRLPGAGVPMPGFGSSDCECEAHLLPSSAQAVMRGIPAKARLIGPLNSRIKYFDWRDPRLQVYSSGVTTGDRRPLALILPRWLGRIGVVVVFLFWGAFFIEHLMEWFVKPFPNLPPVKVCLGQLLHFMMLVGLLVALRWPQVGTPLVVVAVGVFLVRTGANFPFFFAATILPVLVLLGCWWAGRKAKPMSPVIS